MRCPNCSTELLGSMKKCPKCGYDTISGTVDPGYLHSSVNSRVAPAKDSDPGLLAKERVRISSNGKKIPTGLAELYDNGIIHIYQDVKRSAGATLAQASFGVLGRMVYTAIKSESSYDLSFSLNDIRSVTDSDETYTRGGLCITLDNGSLVHISDSKLFLKALRELMGV